MTEKLLNQKCYGSIPHIPGSRLGPGEHTINDGQARICLEEVKHKDQKVYVTEKLDGSNVCVANVEGQIVPMIHAGYRAVTSRWPMHHEFHEWAMRREEMFKIMLEPGERVAGEWLEVAHGTRYLLPHEPFVAFDIMRVPHERASHEELVDRASRYGLVTPAVLSRGDPLSLAGAEGRLGQFGFHGAQEPCEGAVWRVERAGEFQFMAKYVMPSKVDSKYLQNDQVVRNKMSPEAINHGHQRMPITDYVLVPDFTGLHREQLDRQQDTPGE